MSYSKRTCVIIVPPVLNLNFSFNLPKKPYEIKYNQTLNEKNTIIVRKIRDNHALIIANN
ncbi:hypothetical protein HMI01_24830 [Halolactibacillus miurensis]|uniref:Uncharacterized protein n=1 Tax=Halolactibacillus miurensis TaxID=306541 RepID=A0ABQ0W0M4_9BACI|nr:hypothetical protein HMI01_24830 [Halolactibacillus miurensis]